MLRSRMAQTASRVLPGKLALLVLTASPRPSGTTAIGISVILTQASHHEANKGSKAIPELLDRRAFKAYKVRRESEVRQALTAQQVHKGQRVTRETQAHKVQRAIQDLQVRKVRKVRKDQRVMRLPMPILRRSSLQRLKVKRVLQVRKVREVRRANKAFKVRKVLLVTTGIPPSRVLTISMAQKVTRAIPEPAELMPLSQELLPLLMPTLVHRPLL